MTARLSPNFYKTTVVLIDDEQHFLDALTQSIPASLRHNTFTDPISALAHINNLYQPPKAQSDNLFFNIGNKQYDYMKYDELSVVVVDYDMPEMNGLDFCLRIENPSIRKVLLTGAASLTNVVDAFNNGTIHYYLDKKTPELGNRLSEVVIAMQKSYFQESLELEALVKEPFSDIFLDQKFSDYFQSVCNDYNVHEHYFNPKTSSFTLCSSVQELILVVVDDEQQQEHMTIISEEEGPNTWIEKLRSRKYAPFFISSDGFYTPETQRDIDPLFKATTIRGQKNYYCALFDAVMVEPTIENLKMIN